MAKPDGAHDHNGCEGKLRRDLHVEAVGVGEREDVHDLLEEPRVRGPHVAHGIVEKRELIAQAPEAEAQKDEGGADRKPGDDGDSSLLRHF